MNNPIFHFQIKFCYFHKINTFDLIQFCPRNLNLNFFDLLMHKMFKLVTSQRTQFENFRNTFTILNDLLEKNYCIYTTIFLNDKKNKLTDNFDSLLCNDKLTSYVEYFFKMKENPFDSNTIPTYNKRNNKISKSQEFENNFRIKEEFEKNHFNSTLSAKKTVPLTNPNFYMNKIFKDDIKNNSPSENQNNSEYPGDKHLLYQVASQHKDLLKEDHTQNEILLENTDKHFYKISNEYSEQKISPNILENEIKKLKQSLKEKNYRLKIESQKNEILKNQNKFLSVRTVDFENNKNKEIEKKKIMIQRSPIFRNLKEKEKYSFGNKNRVENKTEFIKKEIERNEKKYRKTKTERCSNEKNSHSVNVSKIKKERNYEKQSECKCCEEKEKNQIISQHKKEKQRKTKIKKKSITDKKESPIIKKKTVKKKINKNSEKSFYKLDKKKHHSSSLLKNSKKKENEMEKKIKKQKLKIKKLEKLEKINEELVKEIERLKTDKTNFNEDKKTICDMNKLSDSKNEKIFYKEIENLKNEIKNNNEEFELDINIIQKLNCKNHKLEKEKNTLEKKTFLLEKKLIQSNFQINNFKKEIENLKSINQKINDEKNNHLLNLTEKLKKKENEYFFEKMANKQNLKKVHELQDQLNNNNKTLNNIDKNLNHIFLNEKSKITKKRIFNISPDLYNGIYNDLNDQEFILDNIN